MGIMFSWDGDTQTVIGSIASDKIYITVGKNVMYMNERPCELEIPPKSIDGQVFVPVRTVVENLGGEVMWNEKNRTVYIDY